MKDTINYAKLYENNPRAFSYMEPFLGKYLSQIKVNPDSKILDIGCFQGSNLLPFIELGAGVISGIEKERQPLAAFSKQVYEEYGMQIHKSLDLKVGNVEDYTFKNSFDVILCFKVMQHLTRENSLNLIEKIQNNTKRGGYNLFTIWRDGNNYNPTLGYFKKDEIANLYTNKMFNSWDILECYEEVKDSCRLIYFAARKR